MGLSAQLCLRRSDLFGGGPQYVADDGDCCFAIFHCCCSIASRMPGSVLTRISDLELRLEHGTPSLLLNATTLPRKAGHDRHRRVPMASSCRPVSPRLAAAQPIGRKPSDPPSSTPRFPTRHCRNLQCSTSPTGHPDAGFMRWLVVFWKSAQHPITSTTPHHASAAMPSATR